ncbi:MAG: pilus assembly protein PilM [Phycisphaerales bacterium]|nr:pilus assembly protein PilM [Phycisphaerales bacterium]
MRYKGLRSLPAVGAAPIAIDFGAGGLKALQISGNESRKLVAAAFLPTPDDLVEDASSRLRFQIEQLPKLIRKGGFTTKRAVCLIPASQMFCKHMQFQLSEGVGVDSMLKALLPAQVGCEFESLVCRSVEVPGGGRGGKSEVICMAASRDLVGRLMAALKSAHLEPVGVHGPFQSVLRAFDDVNRREEDAGKTTLYLDLGYASTNVMIAHGTSLVFARTVDLGGLHMDVAIMKQAHVGMTEARELRRQIVLERATTGEPAGEGGDGLALLHAAIARSKKAEAGANGAEGKSAEETSVAVDDRRGVGGTPGMSAEVQPATTALRYPQGVDLAEPLEILTDEICMSLRYHKSMFGGRNVERAVLVGGEARQAWLCQHLARAIRIPVQVGDPISRLSRTGSEPIAGVEFGKAQPGWTAALGMCLSPTDL